MPERRQFLAIGISGGTALAAGVIYSSSGSAAAAAQLTEPSLRPVAVALARPVAAFSVRMPVPATKKPDSRSGDTDFYRIAIRPGAAEILPGLQTAVLGYDGQFIGPTIRAVSGRQVKVEFTNQLDMPANVHLHGGHTPADSDGYPMDLIEPGQSRLYLYPNQQQAATLWYHDHAHHMEAEHIYRGLHGLYLIEDAASSRLGLPSGAYDVPILLRDALFDDAGQFIYGIDRPTVLANGKPQPYFPVAARRYRFRLLNAANERTLRLTLGTGETMTQIASDGGLLPAPVPRTALTISSAERQEIVVDFSKYPVGTQLVLSDATAGAILRFDVVRTETDRSRLPGTLVPLPALPPATREREVDLSFDLSGDPVGLVNGRTFDESRVDFTIKRGTTEIWHINNLDPEGIDHTFHMHLTQFRVLDRDGVPPGPDDAGLKDTIHVPSGARNIRLQATFPEYTGRYVFHCHFVEHSAIGMMAVMEIVP